MQLVLSNNRVLAHGENFLSMGGVVINTETGAKYENATVAECDGCPSDINEVGYEYHAGQFVPCAPYGKGNGNLAVLCNNDCKAIKDSGIPLDSMCIIEKMPYKGTGTQDGSNPLTLTFNYPPAVVFISPQSTASCSYGGYIQGINGVAFSIKDAGETSWLEASIEGNTVEFFGDTADKGLNVKNAMYDAIAICIKGAE